MHKFIEKYFENDILQIEVLMEDYNNYIQTIIRNYNIDFEEEDLEEIVLDVYLTLWNNQNKLIRNVEMSPYIAGVTKNLIKKKIRTNKKLDNIEDYEEKLVDLSNIELTVTVNEESRFLKKQINKLKEEDKDIFIAYYYAEKSIKEIAVMYNISETKVKSKLFRTRKKLKKILKEGGYSYDR